MIPISVVDLKAALLPPQICADDGFGSLPFPQFRNLEWADSARFAKLAA
ncbi:MAG: hypothetical protein IT581_16255 [Verrucomicrobiales bacterium]|nr:hypothetical protein [Verrucomicrobiales bacterium]